MVSTSSCFAIKDSTVMPLATDLCLRNLAGILDNWSEPPNPRLYKISSGSAFLDCKTAESTLWKKNMIVDLVDDDHNLHFDANYLDTDDRWDRLLRNDAAVSLCCSGLECCRCLAWPDTAVFWCLWSNILATLLVMMLPPAYPASAPSTRSVSPTSSTTSSTSSSLLSASPFTSSSPLSGRAATHSWTVTGDLALFVT